jgi:TetR/AcrR family transcriptional regulator, regulator of cefoperazone and chloramphenicol sensitivity
MSTVDQTTIGQQSATGPNLRERLCQQAIDHFGRFGFDETMLELSIATDTDVAVLTELFGSIEGLRAACDEYILETVSAAKTAALTSHDPRTWLAQVDAIDSYAPMISYLTRTLRAGDESGRALLQRMTDGIERYLEVAVDAGTVRPTTNPKGRAHVLAMFGAGGFLLYQSLHPTPNDVHVVLHDYVKDVMVPALELYTYGLMTDDAMFKAFMTAPTDS